MVNNPTQYRKSTTTTEKCCHSSMSSKSSSHYHPIHQPLIIKYTNVPIGEIVQLIKLKKFIKEKLVQTKHIPSTIKLLIKQHHIQQQQQHEHEHEQLEQQQHRLESSHRQRHRTTGTTGTTVTTSKNKKKNKNQKNTQMTRGGGGVEKEKQPTEEATTIRQQTNSSKRDRPPPPPPHNHDPSTSINKQSHGKGKQNATLQQSQLQPQYQRSKPHPRRPPPLHHHQKPKPTQQYQHQNNSSPPNVSETMSKKIMKTTTTITMTTTINKDKDKTKTKTKTKTAKVSTPIIASQNGYRFLSQVGQGSFAKIYRTWDTKSQRTLACKYFDLRRLDEEWVCTCLKSEMRIMLSLRHTNVCYALKAFKSKVDACIVMPYLPNGTIETYIIQHGPVPEDRARQWFTQLVSGVDYLHTNRIVHRDLKLENFLLDQTLKAVITDFGFAVHQRDRLLNTGITVAIRRVHRASPWWRWAKPSFQGGSNVESKINNNNSTTTSTSTTSNVMEHISYEQMLCETACGTVEYSAPEVNKLELEQNSTSSKVLRHLSGRGGVSGNGGGGGCGSAVNSYTPQSQSPTLATSMMTSICYDAKAVDVYALGVCLFEMLNAHRPYLLPSVVSTTSSNSNSGGSSSTTTTPAVPAVNAMQLPTMEQRKRIYALQCARHYRYRRDVKLTRMCIELIHLLLSPIPEDRPTCRMLLCCNWILDYGTGEAAAAAAAVGSVCNNTTINNDTIVPYVPSLLPPPPPPPPTVSIIASSKMANIAEIGSVASAAVNVYEQHQNDSTTTTDSSNNDGVTTKTLPIVTDVENVTTTTTTSSN